MELSGSANNAQLPMMETPVKPSRRRSRFKMLALHESGFGLCRALFGPARHHADSAMEECIHHVLFLNPADHDMMNIFKVARKTWFSVYGCPRKSPSSPRFNKGVPKKRANLKSMIGSVGQNSDKVRVADLVASVPESHFIQTRREAVHQQLVKDEHLRKVESYVEPSSALNAWDERHETESERLGKQTQKRKIEALREQHLSVDEGSADMDLRAAAVEFEQNQIKAQRAREEKQSKQFTQQVGMKPTEVFSIIKDLQVFIVNVDVPRQIIEKLKVVHGWQMLMFLWFSALTTWIRRIHS